MPIRDQAAMERSLDNDYGTTRGPNAPASFDVCLFDDNPEAGGTEIPDTSEVDDGAGGVVAVPNGYAPAYLSNDDWLPADGGLKDGANPVQFADALAEWVTVRYWGLRDRATGQWWEVAPLAEPLEVTGAGDGPAVSLTVFYANNLDEL